MTCDRGSVPLRMTFAALLVIGIFVGSAARAQSPANDLATVAEKTGYRRTASYTETVEYIRRLQAASPWLKADTFGVSPQGRNLYYVVASREKAFTPEAARKTGKVIVLIQNGIHAGEIEGKDASLALLRDVAVTRYRASLLDSAILLVIPIFNVDGHENNTRFTRANQNGPENAGFRVTAQLYNLNRDYVKADAPEMRAWLRLWRAWAPDFFIDDHVTDGGDWPYVIHYTMPWHPNAAESIRDWTRRYFDPDVTAKVEKEGYPIFPYAFPRGSDPRKGLGTYVDMPRLSTGYTAIRNRPGLLIEMHMLKDYRTRVLGNYAMLTAVLDNLNRNATSLHRAIAIADSETVAGLTKPYPLSFQPDGDSVMVDFAGYASDTVRSEASGAYYPVYDHSRPTKTRMPYFKSFKPRIQITPPRAYLIPREWTVPIEGLRLHGVHLDTLRAPLTARVELYFLDSAKWGKSPYEGHVGAAYRATAHDTTVTFPAGTVVIDLHQRAAKLAIHALEPQSPDAFLVGGMWNTIFERKEYIEDYVIDPLADSMLASDGKLRAEFEARLAADSAFAHNPDARRRFFYERCRYAETQVGWYPVARLMDRLPPVDPWPER